MQRSVFIAIICCCIGTVFACFNFSCFKKKPQESFDICFFNKTPLQFNAMNPSSLGEGPIEQAGIYPVNNLNFARFTLTSAEKILLQDAENQVVINGLITHDEVVFTIGYFNAQGRLQGGRKFYFPQHDSQRIIQCFNVLRNSHGMIEIEHNIVARIDR